MGSRPGRATPETETPHGIAASTALRAMGVSLILLHPPLLFHSNCTRDHQPGQEGTEITRISMPLNEDEDHVHPILTN